MFVGPQGTLLERAYHRVESSAYIKFVKEKLGPLGRDLVGYREVRTGRYVVCLWVNRLAGAVRELQSFEKGETPTPEDIEHLRFNLDNGRRYRALKAWVADGLARSRALMRQMADLERQRHDERQWFKRARTTEPHRDDPLLLEAI